MGLCRRFLINFIATLIALYSGVSCIQPPAIDPAILIQSQAMGECQSCKIFIKSFQKGLERTARGKFEGGDAAWEEEKLKKSYKRSEVRLIDIQEGLCKEESKYSVQCHNAAEKAEEFIEEWWTRNVEDVDKLFAHICIDKMKVCCPDYHYGSDCKPCSGDHNNLCSGNGKCRGDGTRKGNGTCLCDKGYTGENCNECAVGYYLSYEDDNKMLCSKCHVSCMGGCRQGTQKDCVVCKPGFTFDLEEGCQDINECDDVQRCSQDQFCLNSLGSFKCLDCDKGCKGCFGDGPDMCRACNTGYSKKGEFCIADGFQEHEAEILTTSRYMTYVGLLTATGLLLGKSTPLGSMVGIMVLSYIVGAEYYCMINGHGGLLKLKDFDLSQLLVI